LAALLAAAVLSHPAFLLAQYILILKNGRQITAQAYREEGRMIKIYGIGGEIGVPRDQIQSIRRAGEAEGRGLDLRGADGPEAGPPESREQQQKSTVRVPGQERESEGSGPASGQEPPGDLSAEQRAKEEEEYRKRIEAITQQLKSVKDQYLSATRGRISPDPTLLESEEAIRGRNDDLSSRLKDRQHSLAGPSDAGPVRLSVPSPFIGQPPITTEIRPGESYNASGLPIHNPAPAVQPGVDPVPPPYTERERELSDLRNRMNQLVKERERLIEEMKRKNFETGNLFLD
jgi:hypothetical protein